MLCGARSYSAIAEWGRNSGARLTQALSFTRQSPYAATLYRVLRQVDRDGFVVELGTWAEGLLAGTPRPPETAEGIAVDGKTLRGSRKQGVPGAHLLSAVAHRVGVTLAQHAAADNRDSAPRTCH